MLTEEQVKEKLSIYYVRLIAAICGYTIQVPEDDMDSVDLSIIARLEGPKIEVSRPRIDVQLKCTSQADIFRRVKTNEETFPFPLSKKNYDELCVDVLNSLRLLIVLVLPPQPHRWLKVDPASLILRRCAF